MINVLSSVKVGVDMRYLVQMSCHVIFLNAASVANKLVFHRWYLIIHTCTQVLLCMTLHLLAEHHSQGIIFFDSNALLCTSSTSHNVGVN